ncbi:MAG: SpoIIE family protein phosphatase [Actinobacteria bacterium]|nr:SpoIIE family protein phosphatase [Actinomycetota bacterium]
MKTADSNGVATNNMLVRGYTVQVIAAAAVLAGLYASSLYNYLLFHSLVELFSVVIAAGIFMVAWNSRKFIENDYLLLLGIAYLFVGGVDLIHTLAYKGMNIFPGFDANLPTQLWILARYMQSVSLLLAPVFLVRKLNYRVAAIAYAGVSVLALLAIFEWGIFPDAFIEGTGLTTFKVASEYIISTILLVSLYLLYKRKAFFDAGVLRLLAASILVTVASEMAFTLYTDPYGFSNLTGHFLKIVAFYLVYRALIETGLARPYSLLFRNLKLSEEALRESEDKYRNLFTSMNEGAILHEVIYDKDGRAVDYLIKDVNPRFESILGIKPADAEGKRATALYGTDEAPYLDVYAKVAETGEPVQFETYFSPMDKHFSISVFSPAAGQFATIFTDITARKRAEDEIRLLTNRMRLLLESTDEGIYGIDLEGRCTFCNLAAAEMLGYEPEEVLGRKMHELMRHSKSDGSPYPVEECPVYNAARTGHGARVDDEVFWRKDGGAFSVEYSSYPIFEDTAISGAVVTFIDITERKQAQELSDALNNINAAINSTLDFDEIMERVVVESAKAVGAETAAVVLREDDGWVARYVFGLEPEMVGARLTDEECPHAMLAVSRRAPVAIDDAYNDERVNRRVMENLNIRSVLVSPLLVRDEAIGALFFNYHSGVVHFSEAQVDFANKLSASVLLALENSRLYEAERKIADTLQTAILTVPREIAGVDFGYMYRSATEIARIGGDFYDIFELGESLIGFVVGDVSGKGLAAATTTSVVKSTIRAFAYRDPDPRHVLTQTNHAIERQMKEGQFVTAVYGIINTSTGEVAMASAGHPDPFLCTMRGCFKEVARRNPPLGVFTDVEYSEFTAKLCLGDTLVLYTDGLVEARHGSEFFGDERAGIVLDTVYAAPTGDMVEALLAAASEFSKHKLTDDIAVVAIRYVRGDACDDSGADAGGG